ncbi:hypothetical protein SAMN05192574_103185 [Mucilaginibacter gossypiicola]|uniref:Uncharacterized protein n=1 Tax=Mucilaginibacter gossypiicola TaxID=551995 RepID=A0A1H8GKT7_9SPHI|nr:hypothetical protein [Mucilaginibacter gossypiicola]SEN44583.1 hypothetical protein SAMN05192574_103185 [Mucilaginibacter gossypiicola]
MLSIYYKIWVDAITQERAKKGMDGSWKVFTIISMSLIQGVNLLSLLFILRFFTDIPILFTLDLTRDKAINAFIAGLLVFLIPFVILNYLLIFNNDRYNKLMNLYPSRGRKLYRNYVLISLGIIVVPFVFKLIF